VSLILSSLPFLPRTLTSSADCRNNIQQKEMNSLDNCLISQESVLYNAANPLRETMQAGVPTSQQTLFHESRSTKYD
jgi:hypothetical protein